MNNPLNFALGAATEVSGVTPLLFLACPYSHHDHGVRFQRFLDASEAAARLMAAGYAVFSPISHGHAVCEADCANALGTDAESWAVINDAVLSVCHAVVVLGIPGCIESAGVRREVGLAVRVNIPVNMFRILGGRLVVERGVDPTLWSDDEDNL